MNVTIIRLNVGDFGKIGTYNVQEVGLANALLRLGHNVSVLYLNRDTDSIIKDETYDFVYYLPHVSLGLHGIFNLKLLEEFNPERVIVFSDNQLWTKNVILWCKKKSIPCVHYFGAVLSNNKHWLNQLYTRVILCRNKSSYKYSINTAKTKEVAQEMYEQNIDCKGVINIGLDTTLLSSRRNLDYEIRKELGFSDDEKIVLYVGRLADDKRPLAALDVISSLRSKNKSYRLIIIGKGIMEAEVLERIKKLQIEDAVTHIPTVPYSDMYKYMVACDCCINMSHVEIFGMTILESMYYGLPIIAHEAPGPNEIIENGVSGFLCASDDPQEWEELIESALNNRETISKNAHKVIVNKFTWDIIAKRFISIR